MIDVADALGTAAGGLGELETALHAKAGDGEFDRPPGGVTTLPRRTRRRDTE
jgi:hypothetical protein